MRNISNGVRKLLVANWKMNPTTVWQAQKIARACDAPHVVIAPPFPFLGAVKAELSYASLGAQDVFFEAEGAYTGEVSPIMLKHMGVAYVIVGHSERRALGEDNYLIAKKAECALRNGLKVIFCVGEPMSVQKKGISATKHYLAKQLALISNLKTKNLIIAYEPIWAIGTGKNADIALISTLSRFIRTIVSAPVLYGGSTNAKNTYGFLAEGSIAGLLVGGASLQIREFKKMIQILEKFN